MLNTDQAIKISPAIAGIQRPAIAGITDPPRVRRFRLSARSGRPRPAARPAAPIDATLYTRYTTRQGSHHRWLGCVRFSAGLKRLLWLREPGPVRKGWCTDWKAPQRQTRILSLAPFMSWMPLVAPIRTRSCSTFIQRSTRLPRIPIRLPLLYPKQSVCLWLVIPFDAALPFMAANKKFLFIGTDESHSG